MKHLILCLLLLFPLSGWAFSLEVEIPPRSHRDLICPGDKFIKGGDPNPWPFGKEEVFPWNNVEGVWAPIEGKCESLFSFQIRTMEDGRQVLQIHQIDPVKCRRQGIGVGTEAKRTVHAAMTNLMGISFDVTLRAFSEQSLVFKRSMSKSLPPQTVVVLTMYPKNDWDSRKSYELQKIAEVPQMICYKGSSSKRK